MPACIFWVGINDGNNLPEPHQSNGLRYRNIFDINRMEKHKPPFLTCDRLKPTKESFFKQPRVQNTN